jgi:hypothetical protein
MEQKGTKKSKERFSKTEVTARHALAIKERLEALAQIATRHEEPEKEIQVFLGEARWTRTRGPQVTQSGVIGSG